MYYKVFIPTNTLFADFSVSLMSGLCTNFVACWLWISVSEVIFKEIFRKFKDHNQDKNLNEWIFYTSYRWAAFTYDLGQVHTSNIMTYEGHYVILENNPKQICTLIGLKSCFYNSIETQN